MFKDAAILYALLALPHTLAKSFKEDQNVSNNNARLRYKDWLHADIEKASSFPIGLYGMCWPMAVLGASLYDGSTAMQGTLLSWLQEVERNQYAASGPVTLQKILPEFWFSRKSGWEDCFHKPFQILA